LAALANSAFPGEQGMLQWHYRSRHPELIAFSNHQFYDNKLRFFADGAAKKWPLRGSLKVG
jgi:superfamily I DNA and/or RNA helicase